MNLLSLLTGLWRMQPNHQKANFDNSWELHFWSSMYKLQLAPARRVLSLCQLLVAFITLRMCYVISRSNFPSLQSFFSFFKHSLQKAMLQFNRNHYTTLGLGTQQNLFLLCWRVQGLTLAERTGDFTLKVKGSKRNVSSSFILFQIVSLHSDSTVILIMSSHSDSSNSS